MISPTTRPCPFCYSDDIIPMPLDDIVFFHCEKCGASGPESDDEAMARVLWNTRP